MISGIKTLEQEFQDKVLNTLERQLTLHLNAISKMFPEGHVTLVVRNPHLVDTDVVATVEMDLNPVIESLKRHKEKGLHAAAVLKETIVKNGNAN